MSFANNNQAMSNLSYCDALLRQHDRDRWLACLLAPSGHREALTALYAFNIEIERVRDMVSEPLPGEVRLQWWRDLLEGQARGSASANPVAAELVSAIERHRLPTGALIGLIEAHGHDLYDDLLPTITDLEGYCGETSSALFRLASLILADGINIGSADLSGHAGVAYGITTMLRRLARDAARGQIFIPEDILNRHAGARDDILAGRTTDASRAALADFAALAETHYVHALNFLREAPASVLPAFRVLGIVKPLLRRLRRQRFDVFQKNPELPQWLRQWHMWRFARQ